MVFQFEDIGGKRNRRNRKNSITFRLVRSNDTCGKHGLTSALQGHQPSQLVAQDLVLVVPDRIFMRIG